jgi:signal transduction histidine kinase
MVSPPAGELSTESGSRLLAALRELAVGGAESEAAQLSELARHAAELLAAEAGGVLRFLGDERGVVVGVWREGGTRAMPINAEVDFERRNSALGRARSTGLPARADTYEGLRGELPVVMEAIGLRSSVAAPILLGERVWGALVVSTTREEPLAPDAEQRLGELAGLAAGAIAAAEARHALQASRLRIVEDADEARRGLERELHEGLHQHLLALMLKLRVARAGAPDGSEPARLIDESMQCAAEADAALRELARSIYPVVLSERGLAAAVQAITVRAGVPVSLRRLPSRRFPPVVEATAYFAVAEALACVAEHADATEAVVQVAEAGDELLVEVRDDGSGVAGPVERLRAVGERVRAAGGTLAVESPPGGGTVVRAALPLDPWVKQ